MKSRAMYRLLVLSSALLFAATIATAESGKVESGGSVGGIGSTSTTGIIGNVGTPGQAGSNDDNRASGVSSGLGSTTEKSPSNLSNSGSATNKGSNQESGTAGSQGTPSATPSGGGSR
ncbi:MAG: hypothetical protein ABI041_14530 [Bdellovibrionia bacterium]